MNANNGRNILLLGDGISSSYINRTQCQRVSIVLTLFKVAGSNLNLNYTLSLIEGYRGGTGEDTLVAGLSSEVSCVTATGQ